METREIRRRSTGARIAGIDGRERRPSRGRAGCAGNSSRVYLHQITRRHRRVPPRGQWPGSAHHAGPLRARGHLSSDVSRRLAQRGDRHHRRDTPARAHDVQGQRALQRCEGQQHQAVPGARRRTVQCHDLDGYVAIESDRMRNLWLRESDRQAEMTVVRNEYERGKNDPNTVLMEEVSAAAYVALPYHHPTIGYKSDIEHVPIEKLRQFYDTFYWPNNATVSVVGDVEPAAALALVQKYYGGYSQSPQPIPLMYTEEPAQVGPRRVVVNRPGELGTVVIAYKVPNGRDADQPALEMLDGILSSGKSSRLYHALVDGGLALSASSDTDLRRDLSLHTVYATLAPGASHEKVEQALLAAVEKIKTDGVTAQEIARVKQQVLAGEAYKRDGTAAAASELNEWIAIGDWTLYVTFPQKVERVTAADVQRVAREYLDERQSTTGWFVPNQEKSR